MTDQQTWTLSTQTIFNQKGKAEMVSKTEKQITNATKQLDHLKQEITKTKTAVNNATGSRDQAINDGDTIALDKSIEAISQHNSKLHNLKNALEVAEANIETLSALSLEEKQQILRDAEALEVEKIASEFSKGTQELDKAVFGIRKSFEKLMKTIPDGFEVANIVKQSRARSETNPTLLCKVVLAEALNKTFPETFEKIWTDRDGTFHALFRRGGLADKLDLNTVSDNIYSAREAGAMIFTDRLGNYAGALRDGSAEPGEYDKSKITPAPEQQVSNTKDQLITLNIHLPVQFDNHHGKTITKGLGKVLISEEIAAAIVESGRATYASPHNDEQEQANLESRTKLTKIYENENSLIGGRLEDLPVPYFQLNGENIGVEPMRESSHA